MALIVETGTGLSTAESYISVADATQYFTDFGNADAWSAIDATSLEALLRKSSRDLDSLYGASYASTMLVSTQGLLFPRVTFTDNNGRSVSGMPKVVAQATAELALINSSTDVTGVASTAGNVKKTLLKADMLVKETEYFAPTAGATAALRKVAMMLSPYLESGNSGLYARVTRG